MFSEAYQLVTANPQLLSGLIKMKIDNNKDKKAVNDVKALIIKNLVKDRYFFKLVTF
jgi:ABC-type uncharacterized transport system substrate-binding protein